MTQWLTRAARAAAAGTLALALLAGPLPSAALAQDVEPAPIGPALSPPAEEPAEPGFAEKSEMTVELISTGDGDKQRYRYEPKPGRTEKVAMTIDINSAVRLGTQPMPSGNLPSIQTEWTVKPTDVADNGDIAFELVITSASAVGDSPEAARLTTSLSPLAGVKGAGVVDSRGVKRTLELEPPDGLPAIITGQLKQMRSAFIRNSPGLPEEPIGAGAKWRTIAEIDSDGVKMTQTVTYTVEKIEGTTLTLSGVSEITADPQPMKAPNLPPNADITLKSLQGSGTVAMVLDLERISPDEGSTEGDINMALGLAQLPQDITQEMRIKSTVKSELDEDES